MRLHNGTDAPQKPRAEKPDLVDVLNHYGGDIYHTGQYPCLFHEDTRPSMSVNVEEGLYHCFACGAGGDAWTVIETKEGTDFEGAVAYSASRNFARQDTHGGSEDVRGILGRRRSGPSRGAGPAGRGGRVRGWVRPW